MVNINGSEFSRAGPMPWPKSTIMWHRNWHLSKILCLVWKVVLPLSQPFTIESRVLLRVVYSSCGFSGPLAGDGDWMWTCKHEGSTTWMSLLPGLGTLIHFWFMLPLHGISSHWSMPSLPWSLICDCSASLRWRAFQWTLWHWFDPKEHIFLIHASFFLLLFVCQKSRAYNLVFVTCT